MPLFLLMLMSLTSGELEASSQLNGLESVYSTVVSAEGRVDYGRLKNEPELMAALETYAAYLAEVDLDAITDKNSRIALLANAYNTFILIGVTRAWPVDSVRKIRPLFGFFKKTEWQLGRRKLTLDSLENELLRPLDNRIHFLINCASNSCPVLVPQVFTAENVTSLMDANLQRFLADPEKNRFNPETGHWQLSKIFDWFAADFGGKDGLVAFIQKVRPELAPPQKVDFLDYDWGLNGPTPAKN